MGHTNYRADEVVDQVNFLYSWEGHTLLSMNSKVRICFGGKCPLPQIMQKKTKGVIFLGKWWLDLQRFFRFLQKFSPIKAKERKTKRGSNITAISFLLNSAEISQSFFRLIWNRVAFFRVGKKFYSFFPLIMQSSHVFEKKKHTR